MHAQTAALRWAISVAFSLVYSTATRTQPGEHELCDSTLLFHQMLAGQDIAQPHLATSASQRTIFNFAKQMQNFIYIVGDAEVGECAVIDGVYDPEGIVAAAASAGCNVTKYIGSHYHYDHIGNGARSSPVLPAAPAHLQSLPGLRYFVDELSVPAYIHETERDMAALQTGVPHAALTPLTEGDEVRVGRVALRVLHTPGHSPGSIVLAVNVDGGDDRLLITADTIFPGSCGRLDLPGSSVDAMWHSMRKLAKLEDDLPVFPGHGYSGDASTIGREKQTGMLRESITLNAWRRQFGQG